MKRFVITLITIGLLFSFAYAGQMQPVMEKKPVESPAGVRLAPRRNVPQYTFTKTPTTVAPNYYDYMIGSYNGLPLQVIPQSAGGGYFMTYHGKSQPTTGSTRRMFYTYINAAGDVVTNNEITNTQNHEGYGTVAVDPVSGKPFYAWHANTDTDAELEVQLVTDAFLDQYPGLFNDVTVIIDNPYEIGGTNTSEFIWPTAVIGPSPIDGKRRIYVVCRNAVSNNAAGNPSENPLIAYTDFDEDDVVAGTALNWGHIDIPEMTAWNHDQSAWRRPFHSIAVDRSGNVYYAGYHFGQDANDNSIDEPDMDVFMCGNYGQGEWTRVSSYSKFPVNNPPSAPGSTVGYFEDQNGNPHADGTIGFSVMCSHSGHANTVTDIDGRVHSLGIWALSTDEGSYYPNMQYLKAFVFDPTTNEFTINEVYPQKDPEDEVNDCFIPWDIEAPFGVPEYIEYEGQHYLQVVTDWPFPHWDDEAHEDAMGFHYNNAKLSEANEYGMMAAVWQNSWRARQHNKWNDLDYFDYMNTPEIWISVSPDNGDTWSEPIVIDNQSTLPEFEGIKPMWVYPANKVIFSHMDGEHKVGKLGLMFYNDFTWGSHAITPPYHSTNDGGEVMFTELMITFPVGGPTSPGNDQHTMTPAPRLLGQNYPNPFNPTTTISYTIPRTGEAKLAIYNVKGQLVNTLVNEVKDFGEHKVVWNGTDSRGNNVPSGIYFYRFTTNDHVETKKMMLMK